MQSKSHGTRTPYISWKQVALHSPIAHSDVHLAIPHRRPFRLTSKVYYDDFAQASIARDTLSGAIGQPQGLGEHCCAQSGSFGTEQDNMVWTANCTVPPEGTTIVGGLPLRSTADIVWPCLATLIACTYTALHLDVIADEYVQ